MGYLEGNSLRGRRQVIFRDEFGRGARLPISIDLTLYAAKELLGLRMTEIL
jgi:hypothetical protein